MTLPTLKSLYSRALFIRAFEDRIAQAADAGAVPGLVHLASGTEMVELAVTSQLEGPKDQVTGSHRSHGLALAMGADPEAVAREILGRSGGLSGGLGGTQHLLAPELGFLSSNGIVGGQVPMAAGAALSAKTLKTGGIAVAFLGDGAVNQGAVLETLNLAVVLGLPLLFVIENNGLGQSTAASFATSGSLLGRVRAFGLAAEQVNGSDMTAVLDVAARLVGWVRKTMSPAVIIANVPRLAGHYHGDPEPYIDGRAKADDPLSTFRHFLIKSGIDEAELDSLAEAARTRADLAVAAAEAAADTSADALGAWQAGGGV